MPVSGSGKIHRKHIPTNAFNFEYHLLKSNDLNYYNTKTVLIVTKFYNYRCPFARV